MNHEPLTKSSIDHHVVKTVGEWDCVPVREMLSALEGLKEDEDFCGCHRILEQYRPCFNCSLVDKWFPILLSQPSTKKAVSNRGFSPHGSQREERGVKAGELKTEDCYKTSENPKHTPRKRSTFRRKRK